MTEEKFKIAKPGNYVTEEGRKAEVVAENMNARIESRWIGWVDGKARAWRADGTFYINLTDRRGVPTGKIKKSTSQFELVQYLIRNKYVS